jgi:hypothetical protein
MNLDDFVMRQQTEYPGWINREYMSGRNGKSYQEWYVTEVKKLKYQEGVLSKENMEIVVRDGEAIVAQNMESDGDQGEELNDDGEAIEID